MNSENPYWFPPSGVLYLFVVGVAVMGEVQGAYPLTLTVD